MALAQQQPLGQGAKSKNRKAKRQKNESTKETISRNKQQASNGKLVDQKCQDPSITAQPSPNNKQQLNSSSVKPSERTSLTKKDDHNKLKPTDKDIVSETVTPVATIHQSISASAKHQQLINEEPDEIDAGIEVDGSSNSGSSVKDSGEDPIKSNSVSPVMAQAAMKNNISEDHSVPQIDEVKNDFCPKIETLTKRTTITREQLAQDRQVIEADEQHIQEKLQFKQRKSSVQESNIGLSKSQSVESNGVHIDDAKNETNIDKSSKPRRKFSTQSSQEGQNGSLCKVCGQHVYQMERMLAEKSIYHKQCFRCYQCKVQLRIDNYSSHEGQVYCKAHHRQLFQPQVKLDNENDVDVVAKSTIKTVDDYLLHRGRLSDLKFSFLNQSFESKKESRLPQPKALKRNVLFEMVVPDNNYSNVPHKTPTGSRQRQMIICENEPVALPEDVVRSDTKVDDGIDQIKLDLNNILQRFEKGSSGNQDDSQPSSATVVIDKPSFNIKKTLLAFENNAINSSSDTIKQPTQSSDRPIVKKLNNIAGFLNEPSNQDVSSSSTHDKVGSVKRSESLMKRLKKYESRIAGEKADDSLSEDEDENNNIDNDTSKNHTPDINKPIVIKKVRVPKLSSFDMSTLKNKWESGDIVNKQQEDNVDGEDDDSTSSPIAEKQEELCLIRQQLAQRKSGESGSIRKIYENALKEAERQQKHAILRSDSSDLSALSGYSTSEIQQQLLQNSLTGRRQECANSSKPNKDHFQLNLNNKANKLKERFELGLINNDSHDDSDSNNDDGAPAMSKLEQIRQEKLDDLSVFTDGEIKAREARNMFQQIDRRISAGSDSRQPQVDSKSSAPVTSTIRSKLVTMNVQV